jgi:hypothetical protein
LWQKRNIIECNDKKKNNNKKICAKQKHAYYNIKDTNVTALNLIFNEVRVAQLFSLYIWQGINVFIEPSNGVKMWKSIMI